MLGNSYFLINHESVLDTSDRRNGSYRLTWIGTYLSVAIFPLRVLIDLIKIFIEFNGEKVTDFVSIDIRSFDYLLFRRNLRKKFLLVIILTPTIDRERVLRVRIYWIII